MPDTKFSALTAVVTPASTDTFGCDQGGTSKKETRAQLHALESGEVFSIDSGTVGAPGLAVTGDLDTGPYSPGANIFAIGAGGVDAVRHQTAASGVNYVDVTPAATGSGPIIAAAGSDPNIELSLLGKGTSGVRVTGGNDNNFLVDNGGEQYTYQYFSNNGTKKAFAGWNNGDTALEIGSIVASSKIKLMINAVSKVEVLNSGNLDLKNDSLIQRDVNAGLTASTTQTQGQGALTAEFNEVATVANTNDTVTLPTAVAGLKIIVINNGANTLRIFPASGDDLGSGVDTATTLGTASKRTFHAYDATNWG